jgi:hypothetical protein
MEGGGAGPAGEEQQAAPDVEEEPGAGGGDEAALNAGGDDGGGNAGRQADGGDNNAAPTLTMPQIQQLLSGLSVTVNSTTPGPRVKVFSGATSPTQGEVTFVEWEVQVERLIQDGGPDLDRRVRSSLSGVAWQQCAGLTKAKDILAHLRTLFGSTQSPEDLYHQFLESTLQKKEAPSAFLLRLWGELHQIDKLAPMKTEELQKKLYRCFMKGVSASYPLLALELRTKFGHPGTAVPEFVVLVTTVRQLEGSTSKEAHCHAGTTTEEQKPSTSAALSEADLEKIISGVVERLQGSSNTTATSSTTPAQPPVLSHENPRNAQPSRFTPKGACFRCRQHGHYERDCRQPPLNGNQSR